MRRHQPQSQHQCHQKSARLYDGITDIRDSLIDQAAFPEHPEKKPFWKSTKKTWRYAAAAAVLAVAAAIGTALFPFGTPTSAHTIAEADYPQSAPYPDETYYTDSNGDGKDSFSDAFNAWREDTSARRRLAAGYADAMDGFLTKSIRQFLSASTENNAAFSPLNLYIALGMLTELTDGSSREQLLNALDCKDLKTLRSRINCLWNANYCDDGATARILASSLWLNESIRYVPSTMKALANNYYASSYQGEMGSAEYNRLMQDWLNKQTGGLLKEQVSSLDVLKKDTIFALATTVYFRGKWLGEFSPENTSPQTFHAASGDMECNFMHKEKIDETYYWGDHFSAVSQTMGDSGSMWFLLPDEGVTVDSLLDDSQAMDFIVSNDRSEWKQQKEVLVNLAVPKFDISSQTDLAEGMQKLGITDIFDPDVSDFSPMTRNTDGIILSQAKHAVRVAIDEQGVTAAAYTVMSMTGAGATMPDEVIDFVLDRPFLFIITDAAGLPLFTGIVRQPA
ncbi:MAG: hypothetical protein K2N87_11740 [Eubacterium sp.]|nr:hypothetical protein [Eubacterium sp.]